MGHARCIQLKHPKKSPFLPIYMADHNLCLHCGFSSALDQTKCSHCGATVQVDAHGAISIWSMGDLDRHVLESLAIRLGWTLGRKVILQPSTVAESPSTRKDWKGNSATVFLNQIWARQTKGCLTNLGITSCNIVPNRKYNFLFGYAYISEPAAVCSLFPLLWESPPAMKLVRRLYVIALHELAHTVGIEDHPYTEEGCIMDGDVKEDNLATLDSSPLQLCLGCRKKFDFKWSARSADQQYIPITVLGDTPSQGCMVLDERWFKPDASGEDPLLPSSTARAHCRICLGYLGHPSSEYTTCVNHGRICCDCSKRSGNDSVCPLCPTK